MKIKDFATGKELSSSPEEAVRQEYERVLVEDYGYKKSEIDIEVRIPRGSRFFPDRADIVVFRSSSGREPSADILGIVEVKRHHKKEGLEQVKSYMTATSAIWAVWTNGDDIAYLCRPEGTHAVLEGYLNNIPSRGQSIQDVGKTTKQKLEPFGRTELKSAFRRILRTLYANANISRREKLGGEMIKLIFSKIEDEKTYQDRTPDFRALPGEKSEKVKSRICELFERVKKELKEDNVFSSDETIALDAKSTTWVVGQLQRASLLKTDTDVVGDAFEVFAESRLAGEKGEFFTPRGVIDLAVRLTNPQPEETIFDPACGSGGFLIHTMKSIWRQMEKKPRWKGSPRMREHKQKMASQSIFGIDKENDLVKIAKAYMAISGDGRSNIVHENTLKDHRNFNYAARQKFVRGDRLRVFDIILTNPPFGTKTRVVKSESKNFQLGYRWKKSISEKWEKSGRICERDPYVLFIERCLDMLSSKGRLAIVLPETVFHAPKTEYLRQFIEKHISIKAIIELPHNTFRPHCNAKTCLLIGKKEKQEKGKVIMAVPKEVGHDHQGRPLYRLGTEKIWDDLPLVAEELSHFNSKKNQFVFSVPRKKMTDNWMPSYYKGLVDPLKWPKGQKGIQIGELVKRGILGAWDGHGSPPSSAKGRGNIPYIRVADIVNWELYRNPVSGVPKDIYKKMTKNRQKTEPQDILFVRRGSFRIGTVAMVSPRDKDVLLTRELLTFRVLNKKNNYGINAFYLLWLLSSDFVQDQISSKVFVDTTLPNIGYRWREIILPLHIDKGKINEISTLVEKAIKRKWKAQEDIQKIREITHSNIVT